jgi:hypothetical protein
MRGPCWTLDNATDGIGRTFPQHQEMGRGYDYDAPDSVHKLPFDAIPSFEPNFNTVIIHGHAKLTDLLSSAPIIHSGFLVSPRLRALLEQFVLPPHRFYPVPMTHRGKTISGYCWLQLPEPHLPLTERSSVAEAEAAIRAVPELASLDLLRLYRPTRFHNCFVSDPLRRAMESAGITGVRFGTTKLFRSAGNQDTPNPSQHLTSRA